jgi:hypothetical protein
MAEIEATTTPHNPNEGDPESKIYTSSASEHFDEKGNIHEEDQAKFEESYEPDV